jgi:hypothetical protein
MVARGGVNPVRSECVSALRQRLRAVAREELKWGSEGRGEEDVRVRQALGGDLEERERVPARFGRHTRCSLPVRSRRV